MIFNKVVYVAAPKVQLAAPSNLIATPGTGKISLTWTDPEDIVRTGKTVATWAKTRIVRKEGAPPNDHNDGVIVVESTEKNQYQSTSYDDSTVQVGTVYHYGAFSYSEEGVWSEGAFDNATPMAGTPLGELAVGTLIKILENGAPVEYLIVNQGLPSSMYDASCDGCWVLRKDIAESRMWDMSDNDYKNSDIHAYLNGSWTSRYSAGVLSQIKQVKIPYHNGTGSGGSVASGANGLSCKIFLPSGYEVGFSTRDNSYFPRDGAKLSYFSSGISSAANNKRIANYNGSATDWWLRSPYNGSPSNVWGVNANGRHAYWYYGSTYGVRPALVLPSTALVDQDLNLIEEVSA